MALRLIAVIVTVFTIANLDGKPPPPKKLCEGLICNLLISELNADNGGTVPKFVELVMPCCKGQTPRQNLRGWRLLIIEGNSREIVSSSNLDSISIPIFKPDIVSRKCIVQIACVRLSI
jgi:hypothetical protein